MVYYIQQLLFQHDCVIVPGLGAFIGNYQPAKVRLYESKIYPPAKAIAFNRSLKNNDGLLISRVAQAESVAYKQAEEKVQAFVQDCLSGLEKNKSYLFQDIGRLYFDAQNNFLFEPADTVNYLLETNSLPAISIEPVERLKTGIEDTRPVIENDHDVENLLAEIEAEQRVKNKRSNAPYWVSFVLAIGLLSTVVGVSLRQGDFSQTNRSTFFPDLNSLLNRTVVKQEPAKKIEKKVEANPETVVAEPVIQTAETVPTQSLAEVQPLEVSEPVAEPVAPVVKIPKAYIVVGAFFDQQYADKTISDAAVKGYRALQIDDYDGALHRVLIESDIQRVQTDLAAVKASLNARAWVYCTNCSH